MCVCVCVCVCVKVKSKVGDRSQGFPQCSFFNSYYIVV